MTTTKPKAETQELPWWTEEELQAVSAIHDLVLATRAYDVPVAPWQIPVRQLLHSRDASDNTSENEYEYYKAEVLDKYRSNKYCDIGFDHDNQCHYIRFLNTDSSKPPYSRVPFRVANASASDSKDVLIVQVKVSDRINIPPRQMQHWNQYQIQTQR